MSELSTEDLDGWQAIAGRIGVSVRQAQKLEQDEGLPVRRIGGGRRPRVQALASDLDEWKRQRIAAALPGSPELSSPAPKPRLAARHAVTIAAVAVVLCGLALWATGRPPLGADHGRVDGRLLTVSDGRNRPLWSHALPGPPNAEQQDEPRQASVDLDGDGRSDFVYNFYPRDDMATPNTLMGFKSTGQLLWQWRPGGNVMTLSGTPLVQPFRTNLIGVLGKAGQRSARLVVGSHDSATCMYQLVLLDGTTGKKLAEYWHPGWFFSLHIADINEDGKEELLLGGVNDSQRAGSDGERRMSPTLVVLDPDRMTGHGPTLPGDTARRLVNVPDADELAVLLFAAPRQQEPNYYYRVARIATAGGYVHVQLRNTHHDDVLYPFVNLTLDSRLRVAGVVPEQTFAERLRHELPRSSSQDEYAKHLQNRLGGVSYLKNHLAQ